jgi:hypothetical protein
MIFEPPSSPARQPGISPPSYYPASELESSHVPIFTQQKAIQMRNYFLAINRNVVKDVLAHVIYQCLHDCFHVMFQPVITDGLTTFVPVEDYDLRFNNAFLEMYCEEPPRPHYPNVNGRIKLRTILRMFNSHGSSSEEYRIFWLSTPAFRGEREPLRMPTKRGWTKPAHRT